jgi:poly-gamma-glutamate synthesis protein (capsule biosynthesis protein)
VNRRHFLVKAGKALLGVVSVSAPSAVPSFPATADPRPGPRTEEGSRMHAHEVTLFVCGDVMTGRGVDQILPHPSKPDLREPYLRSALGYVELAERASGPIPRPVDFAYVWGDALTELERMRPAARIINLETAVTTSEEAWPRKRIHYRMHPGNVACLSAAKIDCCVLANNHVLDWGYRGLAETLDALRAAGIGTVGAGSNAAEAAAPATIEHRRGGRVLVFAYGTESAGVPRAWAAGEARAGVSFLDELSPRTAEAIARQVGAARRAGDIVVVSLHWGSNWGYGIAEEARAFAHRLIDAAQVDLVHGHSSHHPKGIEVYRDRPILYGCGDLLNDYEGISGYEPFRPDLVLMYFPTFDASTGKLSRFALTPMQLRHFRLNRARGLDVGWIEQTLNREGRALGTRVERQADDTLVLRWA